MTTKRSGAEHATQSRGTSRSDRRRVRRERQRTIQTAWEAEAPARRAEQERIEREKRARLYAEKNWATILEYSLERIAVLRGQIVHGAATRGSKLNRESLDRSRKVLESLLPDVLQLLIEHRADDDWPPLCYPPIKA